jgi:hypothetical protein
VEATRGPGDALADQFCFRPDENAHGESPVRSD